jgi:hypothetical protein
MKRILWDKPQFNVSELKVKSIWDGHQVKLLKICKLKNKIQWKIQN